jgi:hypothetical protein
MSLMKAAIGIATLFLAIVATPAACEEPVISVWYRGNPPGVPRQDDLATIRAFGFTGITWPGSSVSGLARLSQMAEVAGLTVVVQPSAVAMSLQGRVNLEVSKLRAQDIPAIGWRALSRGARIVSFDPGQAEGTGLGQPGRPVPAWIAPAAALARHVAANGPLFEQLRPGPAPTFRSSRPSSLEVVLLEGPRCWVAVATNTGRGRARAVVQLSSSIPYADWVSLIDGSTLGMLSEKDGPRWTIQLERGEAKVYVIDKTVVTP